MESIVYTDKNKKNSANKRGKVSLSRRIWEYRASYVLIAPFSIVFFLFTIIPVIIAICFSFTYYNILQSPKFIGWNNYVKLFFQDEIFFTAIKNTLIFAVVTGPIGYLLSFILAWFVNELNPRLRAFMTLLFYAPALSGVTYIWTIIFNGVQYGYLNSIFFNLGLLQSQIQWFVDPP